MAIEVRKREGETSSSMLYRFTKRVQHSGLVKEVRKRQFTKRVANRGKRRNAALYKIEKQGEFAESKKYGSK
ncbi:MAG: 30S ribosomal protein S21 [Candidatus Paceibacterota bacterium]|jgi:ribosomal protein S21